MEKKGKVLPSDNNSPNRTDYPRETEPGEKKEGKVLPSDNNNPNRIDYPRETEPAEKKGMFCLQITTAHIRMTEPGKKLKNEGSSLTEIGQGTKD